MGCLIQNCAIIVGSLGIGRELARTKAKGKAKTEEELPKERAKARARPQGVGYAGAIITEINVHKDRRKDLVEVSLVVERKEAERGSGKEKVKE